MFKRICKITFITHGATIYSASGIINDKNNCPILNDTGEEEINLVCNYLKAKGIAYDNIYTCPTTCCTQSAQAIAKIFKQKPKKLEVLSRNHGDWQGTSLADLYQEYGPELLSTTPKNGESLNDFNKRVAETIKKLIDENKGNRIIIVTSPEIVQSALAQTLNITEENQYKILIKTGSLTQISYFKDWSSVIYSNYTPL